MARCATCWPLRLVDHLEANIQQSEIVAFPGFHGRAEAQGAPCRYQNGRGVVHCQLAGLFRRDGWEILFDYAPNANYQTPYGDFHLNDGVLTAVNPAGRQVE